MTSLCESILVSIDTAPELGTAGRFSSSALPARSCGSYFALLPFLTLLVRPQQNAYVSALQGCSRGVILHTRRDPFDPRNWV